MKTISEIKADHQRRHADVLAKLEEHGRLFDAALKAIAKLNVIRADFEGGTLDISISGDRHQLIAAFAALRRCGFDPGSDRPTAGSPTYNAFFRHESGACIWFTFASTQCRRVKTGTKTVEQDVFETVCDEVELPDSVTKAPEPVAEDIF